MAKGDTGELKAPQVSAEPPRHGTGELDSPTTLNGADAQARSEERGDSRAYEPWQRRLGTWRTVSALLLAAVIALLISDVAMSRRAHAIAASYQRTAGHLAAREHQLNVHMVAAYAEIAVMRQSLAESGRMLEIAAQPDFRLIELAPLKPAPGASGFVTESYRAGTAAVRAVGLPQTPPGKTYELWWITRAHGPMKAGMFAVGPVGAVTVGAILPPPGETIVASAITLEPAGGVQRPTGAMYMMGSMKHR